MGYCMRCVDSNFLIKKENKSAALKAIQDLRGKETCGDHFSWIDDNFYEIKTLEEMLHEWRWLDRERNDMHLSIRIGNSQPIQPQTEKQDIFKLEFIGEKLGDDFLLFKTIAPWVEAGSYIEMLGEDGALWRWIFDGKTCVEKEAKISW